MAAVAERFFSAGLTAAPGHLLLFGDLDKHRTHACGAVGAVAKRLFLGLTAGAPDIAAGLDGHDVGMVGSAHKNKNTAK